MDGRGSRTAPPRAGLPLTGQSTSQVVFWIAFVISGVFAAVQVVSAAMLIPILLGVYHDAAANLPALLVLAERLGPFGLVGVLTVIDVTTFTGFAWAARRYWVGLYYVPPVLYLLYAFVILVALVGEPLVNGITGG